MENNSTVLIVQYVLCPDVINDGVVCEKLCYVENGSELDCNVSVDLIGDRMYKENLSVESVIGITVPVLFGILFIIGVTGNTLVLKVLMSHKHMRNTTNILLGSLALTDLFFILLCVPFTAIDYAMSQWVFGSIWCKMSQYFIHVTAFASIWTLVLISFSRYRAILHPIANLKMRNRRNTYSSLAGLWAVILAGNIPLFFIFDEIQYQYYIEVRSSCYPINELLKKIFFTCFFVFGFAIPLALICLLYGLILRKLMYSAEPGEYKNSKVIQSKLRVSRMICIVVIVFAICWLPIDLILLIQGYITIHITSTTVAITVTANCLAYISSCINPILYGFLSQNFRRSYRNLLCCCDKRSSKIRYEMRAFRTMTPERCNSNATSRRNSTAITRLERIVTPVQSNSVTGLDRILTIH